MTLKEDVNKKGECPMLVEIDETIAPPKWWITFTPYGLLEWQLKFDYDERRVFGTLRMIYMRECTIFLAEWSRKYALIQVIKEFMER